MEATIHGLRACLADLSTSDRRVLSLRFGVGGRPHLSDRAVANRLGTNAAAVATHELVAIKELQHVHGGTSCSAAQRTASAHAVAGAANSSGAATQPASKPADAASFAGSGHSSAGLGADGAMLIAVIAACLCVVAYEFRKALFAPPPRR